MEKQKNIPTLRFPEFKGEWERKKLNEIGDFKNGINKAKEDFGFGVPFINLMDVFGKATISNLKLDLVNANANELKLYELKKGDVLFIRSSVKKSGVGETSLVMENLIDTVFSGFLIRFRDEKIGLNLNFKRYCFSTKNFRENLISLSTTSANTNINQESLNELDIFYPTLPEQNKIATFLTSVDDRLNQLKKKKTILEQYKKGAVQKIFDQEIRFKPALSGAEGDDNGNVFPDWTEERLDSIILNFIVPMRDKPKELNGEIPWCRIEDFNGKYLSSSKSGQGVSRGTVKAMNLKIYPVNTLLVSCSANLGFCAIVKHELITNQTFIGLFPDENKVDVEFLFYVMILASRKLNILSSGTTISYLSRESFEKFEINLPCLSEQTKIANFLSAIDEKISLCNKQIAKTELYKKGLFQQMFV